jgi:hypothetical protein
MSEEVKQEGEFKLKQKKATPKKLTSTAEPVKLDLGSIKKEAEPVKVTIPAEVIEQPKKVEAEVVKTEVEVPETIVQEALIEEIVQETIDTEKELEEHLQTRAETGRALPENIEKLVSFMDETGGTVEDYVRLNADYSNADSDTLLKEYYKKTRPHLDAEEIDFLIEDNFDYDEEIDDERDVRKKRLAFKEEVAKAKNYLENVKSKYYDEIKARPGITQEQQKAMDFFNRYNKDQQNAQAQHSRFKTDTKTLFSQDFKGFDFNLGEKSFRYGVSNPEAVAEKQSNITNLVKKFLNEDGSVRDVKGYHKAMYAAENADTIAKHFYEQGKADAIKDVVAKSNNISLDPRASAPTEGFINGFRVKAINGVDTTKLKIKKINV